VSEDRLHSLLVVAFASDGVDATLAALEHSGQARRHFYRQQTFWEYAGGTFG
jgi:hypothetical protein